MPSLNRLVSDPTLELRKVDPVANALGTGPDVLGIHLFATTDLGLRMSVNRLPPGRLAVLPAPEDGEVTGRTLVTDDFLRQLVNRQAAGVVWRARTHQPRAFSLAARVLAERLGLALLTSTASLHIWKRAESSIYITRAEEAETHTRLVAGLIDRLPTDLPDNRPLQGIVAWLADALAGGQVLVSDPRRGVLAAAPQSAVAELGGLASGKTPDSTSTAARTRVVPLAPAGASAETVLAVASETHLDRDGLALIEHAATFLGLIDRARCQDETLRETARAARLTAFHLLVAGEPAHAQRVLALLCPGLVSASEMRVHVIETQSAPLRETTVRRCEAAMAERALVVRCPEREHHVVVIEPRASGHDRHASQLNDVLRGLVRPVPGPRIGSSAWQPLTAVPSAHTEALTALGVTSPPV